MFVRLYAFEQLPEAIKWFAMQQLYAYSALVGVSPAIVLKKALEQGPEFLFKGEQEPNPDRPQDDFNPYYASKSQTREEHDEEVEKNNHIRELMSRNERRHKIQDMFNKSLAQDIHKDDHSGLRTVPEDLSETTKDYYVSRELMRGRTWDELQDQLLSHDFLSNLKDTFTYSDDYRLKDYLIGRKIDGEYENPELK